MSEASARRSDSTGQKMSALRRLGPGLLVTAAFIGPGTVTTTSVAGADFGFALLWAVLFSILAAMVLQEMAARLGIVSRAGVGEALRTTFDNAAARIVAGTLVVAAIALGNAAYQSGNITGASVGVTTIFGGSSTLWSIVIGVFAAALLLSGRYKLIERVLGGLVVVMSVVFIVTAVMVGPDPGRVAAGLVPTIPSGALLTVIGLIGTTVVPYNFFLHASSVQEKWPESMPSGEALSQSRFDTAVSIGIGGVIALAIMATAAAAFFLQGRSIAGAAEMAVQLEPLLGPAAKYFFAVGLLSAGVTSSVTAPLAAAYATAGVVGWPQRLTDVRFRAVWAVILVTGTVVASLGANPVEAILFAQAANGVLLPIVAIFLLVIMNRADLLGEHRNGVLANTLGGIVVLVATGLGAYSVLDVFGVFG